jgi:SOS-response transcriptional repressor LexA
MTPGQTAVYAAIHEHWRTEGYGPSFREIALRLRVSLATVRQRVAAMERRGEVIHEPGAYRSLRTNERNCELKTT